MKISKSMAQFITDMQSGRIRTSTTKGDATVSRRDRDRTMSVVTELANRAELMRFVTRVPADGVIYLRPTPGALLALSSFLGR